MMFSGVARSRMSSFQYDLGYFLHIAVSVSAPILGEPLL